ncbi:MAG: sigma-70 family RNA polymerase sigma factor [Proteobacteria bacterium]|nr:sigma-70 family RNA polymerase sigma factor [Pseudomonadota bacterium]
MALNSGEILDPRDLDRHRPQLLKYAMLQLRNHAQAEDAVQETMVAAIKGAQGFAGGSSVRTWLIGILKHKIIDSIRKSSREQSLDLDRHESSPDDMDVLFKPDGHYADMPADWGNPEEALSRQRFFEVLEECMESLPKATAQAFAMREVMGLDTGEICENLSISASNCWVLLYRARMRLRECLERNWIGAGGR